MESKNEFAKKKRKEKKKECGISYHNSIIGTRWWLESRKRRFSWLFAYL